ncbi:Hint domain-containing protein [Pseudoruegeria sp. HB172150]|uniref:Hint domain-containing protein n=1 Tax=Pseudoruegeria sp. HB172150 TaxID=2721164 RepID=UPI0015536BDE|nr:Hint domain-containing protein [Pseudoruegeria sp. HB172150]
MIDVEYGRRPVTMLKPGIRVRTKDNGYQPVRWVASRRLGAKALAEDPSLRPVRIRAGALGFGLPATDIVVSPQQCVLLGGWRCELLFGEDEVLVPAAALVNDVSITPERDVEEVTYFHFLLDTHEIVYCNGAETECFHPSAGLRGIGKPKRNELYRLFPELEYEPAAFGSRERAAVPRRRSEVSRLI